MIQEKPSYRPRPGTLLLSTFLAQLSVPAHAADCSSTGRLLFLGQTSNLSQSVWLSGTGTGSFELEAPGNNVVDGWTRDKSGLHLSLSPVVSQGAGLPHRLVDVTDTPCVLDKGNQKGGIIFPPSLNIHPQFPIGKLPPDLITPELPVGVMPPIGQIPPVGITPEIPVSVIPPIGKIPPEGITPEVPVAVTPPIGKIPPETITPEVPVGKQPPVVITPELPVLDGRELGDEELETTYRLRFLQAPKWNLWTDNRLLEVSGRRSGLDLDGHSGYITLGADYRVAHNLAIGAMTVAEQTRSDAFNGDWEVESDGASFGPYMAYRLSPQWTIAAAYTYGRLSNDNRIAVLRERYDTERHAVRVDATGQYVMDELILMPEFSLNYSQYQNEGHELTGTLNGNSISLAIKRQHLNFGSAEGGLRVTRGYRDRRGGTWFPYAKASVINAFERPNDGRIVTGDLTEEKMSPWLGTLRVGLQALPAPATRIDANVGYLSLGQNGLDVWEARFYFSYEF